MVAGFKHGWSLETITEEIEWEDKTIDISSHTMFLPQTRPFILYKLRNHTKFSMGCYLSKI